MSRGVRLIVWRRLHMGLHLNPAGWRGSLSTIAIGTVALSGVDWGSERRGDRGEVLTVNILSDAGDVQAPQGLKGS